MNEHALTSDRFDSDKGVRHILRYGHGFEYADLERAKSVVTDAIAHVEHKTGRTGMSADDLPTAMKFLNEKHEGFRSLSDYKKQHIEDALKQNFKIPKPEQKESA